MATYGLELFQYTLADLVSAILHGLWRFFRNLILNKMGYMTVREVLT